MRGKSIKLYKFELMYEYLSPNREGGVRRSHFMYKEDEPRTEPFQSITQNIIEDELERTENRRWKSPGKSITPNKFRSHLRTRTSSSNPIIGFHEFNCLNNTLTDLHTLRLEHSHRNTKIKAKYKNRVNVSCRIRPFSNNDYSRRE